jgi:fluoroacetyl-CoA thioesterase
MPVMDANLISGTEGEKTIEVTADKLAAFIGSGTLDVFATPAMIALME